MQRSILTVDLKPTVFGVMLCDAHKRKPLARQCYHMSYEVGRQPRERVGVQREHQLEPSYKEGEIIKKEINVRNGAFCSPALPL